MRWRRRSVLGSCNVERAVSGRASAVLVMCGHGPAEACAAKASYAPYKAARIKYLGGDA